MSKVMMNGQQVEGRRLQIVSAHEPWTELLLDTGQVLRVRLVITDVFAIEGETTPDGQPLMVTRAQQVTSITPAEESGHVDSEV